MIDAVRIRLITWVAKTVAVTTIRACIGMKDVIPAFIQPTPVSDENATHSTEASDMLGIIKQ